MTERNWEIVGLTPDNWVLIKGVDGVRNSNERPSEYDGITYLTPAERGILRRGLTAAGNDREKPR
jgi:hypothetical protein